MTSQSSLLNKIANRVVTQIELWFSLTEKKQGVRLTFKPADQLKLTKLYSRSIKYKLTISEILDLTMPVLRGQIRTRKKSTWGLGVSVAALTGNGARRILEQEIQKRYPDNQHLLTWRQLTREKQLAAERKDEMEGIPVRQKVAGSSILELPLDEYVDRYRADVTRQRADYERSALEKWRKRKNYRNNPWL